MKKYLRHPAVQYGTTIAIILLSVLYLSAVTDISKAIQNLSSIAPIPFTVALACYYLTIPLRTVRWAIMMSNVGVESDSRAANGFMLLSLFFNTILPAKSGDAYRSHLAAKRFGGATSKHLGIVVVERVLDVLILGIGVIFVSTELYETIFSSLVTNRRIGMTLVLAIGISVPVLFVIYRVGIPTRVQQFIREFYQGISSIRSGENLALILGLTIGIWSVNIIRIGFVAISVGAKLSLIQIILVAILISFLTGFPYSPAGIGIVEVMTTTTLLAFGLTDSAGLTFILTDRLITIGSVIVFGTTYYSYWNLANGTQPPD